MNFIEFIVDNNSTGSTRSIEIEGDFDIAIGLVGDNTDITCTSGDINIRANNLRVEDITNNETLWEITSDPDLFDPNTLI